MRPCNLPIDIMCDLAELPDGVVQMANSHTHKFLVQAMSEFPENACTVLSKLIKKERPDTPTLDWMYAEGGWGALIKVLGRQAQGYVVITKAMELISLVMKKWRLRGRGCGYGGVAQDYDVMAAVVTKCTSLYISDEHIRTTGCDIMSELLLVDGDGGVEYGERVCRPLIDAGACEIIWHAFLMGTPKALFLLGNLWIFGHGRITKAARGLRKIAEALVRLAPGSAMALRMKLDKHPWVHWVWPRGYSEGFRTIRVSSYWQFRSSTGWKMRSYSTPEMIPPLWRAWWRRY